ncbi:rhodanese-like domain-containing protein [Algoriphagus aestuariicola]|uniref:Rhodanese-like domain-containing protein n=1 Tax=Algoriphagus aestuariicola TaxID=1852016 RepID=A0ABS3BK44_9BACT|nr:rhodanese-like domain-containing protein [Algoriphagus aestuariicola]MBN7799674.1 rhodanese-like domain-containing protein [Algoriphagus aestuariicola]
MKIRLLFLFALMLISAATFAQSAKKDSISVLSVTDFEKKLTKKNVVLVDVRTPEEVADGHLDGALNINFLSENFAGEIEALNKKNTYLIYCRTGKKSRSAADLLEKAGFKRVHMLDGGITAWKDAGKPIEK